MVQREEQPHTTRPISQRLRGPWPEKCRSVDLIGFLNVEIPTPSLFIIKDLTQDRKRIVPCQAFGDGEHVFIYLNIFMPSKLWRNYRLEFPGTISGYRRGSRNRGEAKPKTYNVYFH